MYALVEEYCHASTNHFITLLLCDLLPGITIQMKFIKKK